MWFGTPRLRLHDSVCLLRAVPAPLRWELPALRWAARRRRKSIRSLYVVRCTWAYSSCGARSQCKLSHWCWWGEAARWRMKGCRWRQLACWVADMWWEARRVLRGKSKYSYAYDEMSRSSDWQALALELLGFVAVSACELLVWKGVRSKTVGQLEKKSLAPDALPQYEHSHPPSRGSKRRFRAQQATAIVIASYGQLTLSIQISPVLIRLLN